MIAVRWSWPLDGEGITAGLTEGLAWSLLSLKDPRLEETQPQRSELAWLFKSHGLKGHRRLKGERLTLGTEHYNQGREG